MDVVNQTTFIIQLFPNFRWPVESALQQQEIISGQQSVGGEYQSDREYTGFPLAWYEEKATNIVPYHEGRPRFFLYFFVLCVNPSLVLFAMGGALVVVADKVTTDIRSIYLLFLTLDKMKLHGLFIGFVLWCFCSSNWNNFKYFHLYFLK